MAAHSQVVAIAKGAQARVVAPRLQQLEVHFGLAPCPLIGLRAQLPLAE